MHGIHACTVCAVCAVRCVQANSLVCTHKYSTVHTLCACAIIRTAIRAHKRTTIRANKRMQTRAFTYYLYARETCTRYVLTPTHQRQARIPGKEVRAKDIYHVIDLLRSRERERG